MRSSVFAAADETAGLERTKTIGVARRRAVSRCCNAAAAAGSGFEGTTVELEAVDALPLGGPLGGPVGGLVVWRGAGAARLVVGVARFGATLAGPTSGVVDWPAPGDALLERVLALGFVDPAPRPDVDGPAALVCLAATGAGPLPITARPSMETDAIPHRLRTLSPNSLRSSIDATDPTSETARPFTFARTDGTSAST